MYYYRVRFIFWRYSHLFFAFPTNLPIIISMFYSHIHHHSKKIKILWVLISATIVWFSYWDITSVISSYTPNSITIQEKKVETCLTTEELAQINSVEKQTREMKPRTVLWSKQRITILKKLKLDECGDGWQKFADSKIISYKDSIYPDYVALQDILLQENISSLTSLPEASNAINSLVSHIKKYVIVHPWWTRYLKNYQSINGSIYVNDNKIYNWSINMSANGTVYYDSLLQTNMGNMILKAWWSPSINKRSYTFSAEAWVDIAKTDRDNIYGGLEKISFINATPKWYNSELLWMIAKWVHSVPNRLEGRLVHLHESLLSEIWVQSLISNLLFTDKIATFVHQEWNRYYGFPSIELCSLLMNPIQNGYECTSLLTKLYEWSNGKWIVYLQRNWNRYALWITKQHLSEEFINTIPEYRFEKDLISWNDQHIEKVALSFYNRWSLLIENWTVNGTLLNAYWSETTFSWPLKANGFSLTTKTISKEWNQTYGTITYEKSSNNTTYLTYNLTQKQKKTGGEKKINLTHSEHITPTSPFLLQKPDKTIKSDEMKVWFINLTNRVTDYMATK